MKRYCSYLGKRENMVAPRAGAWVETAAYVRDWEKHRSRTPCGCVG